MHKRVWSGAARAVLSMAAACMMAACEKDGDAGKEVPISGDANFTVQVMDYATNVYFDGQFIGRVDAGETRTWSVPSGEHSVKLIGVEVSRTPTIQTVNFSPGANATITVLWVQSL